MEKLRDEEKRRRRIGISSEFSSITYARKCGKNLIARRHEAEREREREEEIIKRGREGKKKNFEIN